MMNSRINSLLAGQLASWETARDNYAALSRVRVKELNVNGIPYKVQFNPARMASSVARVDARSIQERKCFLCPTNLPPAQKGIPFGGHYTILVNPFPIFRRHLTIPEKEHLPQRIAVRFGDMLDLAQALSEYTIFYNGPKCGASAPDHAHFQAGNKGFLPIEKDWREQVAGKIIDHEKSALFYLNDAPRTTLVIETAEKRIAMKLFDIVYQSLPVKSGEEEPMMNVLAMYEHSKWIVFIFPRALHRPSCYTAPGEANLLCSPASVDLGGAFITPVEKDFMKITAEDIERILSEVCLSEADFDRLRERIKELKEEMDSHTEEPKVQVGILFEPQIEFILPTPYKVYGDYEGTNYRGTAEGKQVATYLEDRISWNGLIFRELQFKPLNREIDAFELLDVTIGINFHWERKENQRFMGALKIIVENGKLTGINVIHVEDYLTSVISSEMSASASPELLKAHAVISRSWLLASLFPVGREKDCLYYKTADGMNYKILKEKKQELRERATEAERIMWERLRRNLLGIKFRRQHIIGNYIVDFIALKEHLIIEIDGEYRETSEQHAKDEERTRHLESLGYRLLRFSNREVIVQPDIVLDKIKARIAQPSPLPTEEGSGERLCWYGREAHTRFDVCADDHCQRYQGITRASTEMVKQAIAATCGQVLMSGGKICDARFSKCCGGAFEEFQYCWEDVKHPYLSNQRDLIAQPSPLPTGEREGERLDLTVEAEADRWIRTSPPAFCNTTDKKILSQVLNDYDQETTDFYRWKVEYTQDELSDLIMKRSGVDYGQIIDLIPIARGTSARLWKLKIVGTKKTLTIGKELEIRRTLSPSHLCSSAFVVDKEEVSPEGIPGRFILTGAGWGHGVGLCQIGAAVMGEEGYKYDTILLHYYINAEITTLYGRE